MLSTQARLRVEFLCAKIERGRSVDFADMAWLDKWARSNRSVYEMVTKARRRVVNGPVPSESLDGFLDQLNLGHPDPSAHITGSSGLDELTDFFKAPDWNQRD
jgi:hypothetical protein